MSRAVRRIFAPLPLLILIALVGVVTGWGWPPSSAVAGGGHAEVVALARIALCGALSTALLFVPGAVLRGFDRFARLPLGVVPVPGMFLLAAIGGVLWVSGGALAQARLCRLLTVLILVAFLVASLRRTARWDRSEQATLLVAASGFLMALGRSIWSPGPPGELYAGMISRSLEVGDRPDSRISYQVMNLVMNGADPQTGVGASFFFPYSFSDRGPLPGMIAAPVALLSGTIPVKGAFAEQPWSPFDAQGFMAYRIVMMLLAISVVTAAYSVGRRIAGPRVGLLAAVMVTGTPFILHEVYFTWPKLAATTFCLLAAYAALERRGVVAGLCLGVGFLFHPLALLTTPTLLLVIALRNTRHRSLDWRRLWPQPAGFLAGLGAVWLGWRLVNGAAYTQDRFMSYLLSANSVEGVGPITWIGERLRSLGNTLIPLRIPLFEQDNPSVNVNAGRSDGVIHFFFEYWNGVPFGVGIVFFPFLVMSMVRLARRYPWIVVSLVVVPFVVFAVYWGSFVSGLMREGLHAWIVGVLILSALEIAPLLAGGGPGAMVLRCVLVLRPVEALVMMVGPTLWSHGGPANQDLVVPHPHVDLAGIVLVALGLGLLVWITIRATRPTHLDPARRHTAWWSGLSARPDWESPHGFDGSFTGPRADPVQEGRKPGPAGLPEVRRRLGPLGFAP